jgi:hypothetical protein
MTTRREVITLSRSPPSCRSLCARYLAIESNRPSNRSGLLRRPSGVEFRHREERSDEAIQLFLAWRALRRSGLLRPLRGLAMTVELTPG